MKPLFLIGFSVILCNTIQSRTVATKDDSSTGLKRLLQFLIGGLKNLARMGRFLKMNRLFYRDPREKLDQFRFTRKERILIFKVAKIVYQTYSIGDFNDIDIKPEYKKAGFEFFTVDEARISEIKNGIFKASDDKTAFITDSLKGIVFTSNDTTVIAFKGTSLTFLGIDSSNTSQKDKFFDNVMFNCHPDISKMKEVLYIDAAQRIYEQIKHRYPKNKIILAGHSMGAAIASIIGRKNNEYVLAFASPGEKQIINALGLEETKKETNTPRTLLQNLFHRLNTNTIHIGDCSDAIFRGACNGAIDVCKIAGYNIKTRFHTGRSFCYNKNTDFSLLNHPAYAIIEYLKKERWDSYEIDQTNSKNNECEKDDPNLWIK